MLKPLSGVTQITLEASKLKMLEGYRRAYQWLRLWDLADDAGIAELRGRFEDPVDYMWIHAALASLIRTMLARLGDAARPDLRDASATLVETTESPTAGALDQRLVAEFAFLIARQLVEQHYPERDVRLRFYESSARRGYEIAEPGHPGRKGVVD